MPAYLINNNTRDWNNPLNWSSTSGGTGADTLGSELITTAADRDFSSDTGYWTKDATVSVADGVLKVVSCPTNTKIILRNSLIASGKAYKVTFTISNYTSGYVRASDNYNLFGNFNSDGAKEVYLVSQGTQFSIYTGTGTTSCHIDDISIKEVTSFPSSTVDAIIDANSGTGTITIAGTAASCASFDASGLTTNAITISSSTVVFNCYGNLTEHASLLTWNLTGIAYMYQKGTGTIRTNGKAVHTWNKWYIDCVNTTDTVTNYDGFTAIVPVYLSRGIWTTNNQTIVIDILRTDTVTGARTLNLGSSNFTGSIFCAAGTTFTLNAGTSTITASTYLRLPSTSYSIYNVVYNGVGSSEGASGSVENFTCNNFTCNSIAAVKYLPFSGNIVVNGVLTINGNNSTNYRLLVASSVIGTARTITAASVVASYCDFRDIAMANAVDLSAITGGSGNCGGNTGITFTTAATQYYKHTSGACTWKDATKWFLATNGGGGAGRVPLPQDSAIFDANSFSGSSTLTIDVPRKGSSDFSAVNQAVTTALANAVEIYGSLILGSNITPSGNFTRTLMGRGSYNLNLYDKTLYSINVNAINGTYTNKSNFTLTLSAATCFNLIIGTFDFNDYNYTGNGFQTTAGTLFMGNGIYSCVKNAGNIMSIAVATTFYAENSTIIANPALGSDILTFSGGGKTYNKVQFSGSHTGYFDIQGANTFAELIIDAGRKVRPVNGVTQTVGKLTAIGTQANPITITSPTAAVHTFALTAGSPDPQLDWVYLHYSTAPASKFYAGNGSAALPPMGNGLLYNWYAVAGIDGTTNDKVLAPAGCHIPTSTEWATLSAYLGGHSVSGGKLKSINPIFWATPNTGADNSSRFFAFGSGYRHLSGAYSNILLRELFWTSTQANTSSAAFTDLNNTLATLVTDNVSKVYGNSVRCIVDSIPASGIITDIDGNKYGIVTIGTQTWLTSNLKTTHYADGTAITNVTDNSAWAALTTGAYCSYNNAAIVEYPSNNTNWVMANKSGGMFNLL